MLILLAKRELCLKMSEDEINAMLEEEPFESLEEEYAYVMEHLEELETVDFWDQETLKSCVEALYCVDANAKVKKQNSGFMMHHLQRYMVFD